MENPFGTACAVWHPGGAGRNQYVQFVDAFRSLGGPLWIHIACDSQYELYVNGRLAGFGHYPDPGGVRYYETYDLTPLCGRGENSLGILAWYCGENFSTYLPQEAGLLYEVRQGEMTLACSSGALCRVAPDYQSGEMEKISNQLGYSFRYDAAGYDGWNQPGYRAGAGFFPGAPVLWEGKFLPRPVKNLVLGPISCGRVVWGGVFLPEGSGTAAERNQKCFLAHRSLDALLGRPAPDTRLPSAHGLRFAADGNLCLIVDLGKETAGYFTLDYEADACGVDVTYGEHLEDLRVRSAIDGRHFGFHYEGRPGRQQFAACLRRLGCRYLQLQFSSSRVTLYHAGLLPVNYPLPAPAVPEVQDALHRRIYETCVRTLRLCMHEHYEDCPWREQSMYALDSRNQMLFGYYVFSETEYPKAALRLFARCVRPDGLLELCAPAQMDITIPLFSLAYVLAAEEYLAHSGDASAVRKLYPVLEGILSAFSARADADGLVPRFTEPPYWNFYEWSEGLDGGLITRTEPIPPGYDAPLNAMLAAALDAMERIRIALGLPEGGYAAWRTGLSEAFQTVFLDRRTGLYGTFADEDKGGLRHMAELTQALTLYAGLGAHPERLADALMDRDNGLVPITLSMTVFKYDGILARFPERYPRILDEVAAVWGGMLARGATTFWETAAGAADFGGAGSLCHGWSAVPAYLYLAYGQGMHRRRQHKTEGADADL